MSAVSTLRTLEYSPEQAAMLAKEAVLRNCIPAAPLELSADNTVQKSLDMLRAFGRDAEQVRTLESISCLLHKLRNFRREGRINAYDSTLLRLRRAAQGL